MTSHTSTEPRLQATARAGVWLSTCVFVLLLGVICFFMWTALSDTRALAAQLMSQLDLSHAAPALSVPQATAATALWLVTDLLALAMLWQTRTLFAGIRARGVFNRPTAKRLRRIGWLVFALGPVSVLVNMGVSMLLGYWDDPTQIHGSLAVEDADFYAMVIGLVLVTFGHTMVEAARLEAENKAFV